MLGEGQGLVEFSFFFYLQEHHGISSELQQTDHGEAESPGGKGDGDGVKTVSPSASCPVA